MFLSIQPRVAVGSVGFVVSLDGILDESSTFSGAAAKEIKGETGLEMK